MHFVRVLSGTRMSPLKNVSLWYVDYSELKALENHHRQEEL